MSAIAMVLRGSLIPLVGLVAATACADEPVSRWTFGTQVGQAQGKPDKPDIAVASEDVATMSYDVTATFGDKNRFGWRVFTGYRFTNYLAVHVGYTDLGDVRSRLVDSGQDPDNLLDSGWLATQTVRGMDVGLQLKVPVTERIAVEVRGGKYYWKSHTRSESALGDAFSAGRRGSDEFFGAGMEVGVFDNFSATLGWTRYEVGGEPIGLWTVGTLYRFSMY